MSHPLHPSQPSHLSQPDKRHTAPPSDAPSGPGWDALVVVLLTLAHLQILALAESAALPTHLQDVLRHPILSRLLPPAGIQALGEVGPRPGEPIGLVLFALTLGFALLYLLVDLAGSVRRTLRLKWLLLAAILTTAVFLPTAELILLRQGSGPASYTHDGGVIQTEATIRFLLQGKNPYVEDYTDTPMAEWGFSAYRTALYHYPYLPWTFLFSAPFYLLGQATGFYDQRIVYLLLLLLALILVPRLTAEPRRRLALVALIGLNPLMALDVIFGQNDVFVLCWLLYSLVAWSAWRRAPQRRSMLLLSLLCFGLACASKPTAWFFAPFYGLLLLTPGEVQPAEGWRGLGRAVAIAIRRAWPALAVVALILLPYILWSPFAFYDDVWRWSAGQGETGYQIWGWGASNFVLALGLVPDRFGQWPFWALQIAVALPLLLYLLRRQLRDNSLPAAAWHYGLFLFAFFYAGRFLNENYLSFILAFLALGILAQPVPGHMKKAG